MSNSLKLLTVCLTILTCVFLNFTGVVYAHRMLIKPVEEGIIKVGYEDGRFSRRTEVIVYDEEQNEIARGRLNADGLFYYPEKAKIIVADDGLGHRAEWKVGEENYYSLPRSITITLVVLAFCLVAGFFQYRVQQKVKGGF